jgi:hypothetical protein
MFARFLSTWICVIAFPLGAAQQATVPTHGPPPEQPLNCVDQCILEFSRRLGRHRTRADVAAAAARLSLEPSPPYRNLADAVAILSSLGVPARAVRLPVGPTANLPRLAMVYLPSRHPELPGHVIVVSRLSDGQIRIYDPGKENPVRYVIPGETKAVESMVAIVPAQVALAAAAGSVLKLMIVSLCAGAFAAGAVGMYRHFMRRSRQHPGPQGCVGMLVAVSAMLLWPGCADRERPGLSPDLAEHDFRVVEVASSSHRVKHTFRLTNTTSHPLTISAVQSSCGCITNLDVNGRKLEPGATMELPVEVSLDTKAGYFKERIVVRTSPESGPACVLTLKGFVKRPPRLSSEHLVFQAAKGRIATRELIVTQLRLPGEPKSALKTYRIEGGSCFSVLEPRVTWERTSLGMADLWRFLLHYRRDAESGDDSAVLILDWETPPYTHRIALVGQLLPPVELVSDRVVVARLLKVGQSSSEEIPVTVHDLQNAEKVQLAWEPPVTSATLNVQSRRLEVFIQPDRAGRFSSEVQLVQDSQVLGVLQLVGIAE